jgi:hypothetical protein
MPGPNPTAHGLGVEAGQAIRRFTESDDDDVDSIVPAQTRAVAYLAVNSDDPEAVLMSFKNGLLHGLGAEDDEIDFMVLYAAFVRLSLELVEMARATREE